MKKWIPGKNNFITANEGRQGAGDSWSGKEGGIAAPKKGWSSCHFCILLDEKKGANSTPLKVYEIFKDSHTSTLTYPCISCAEFISSVDIQAKKKFEEGDSSPPMNLK